MQGNPTSITSAHADSWKNPQSLGFSTWQRHTAVNLSRSNSGTLGDTDGRGSDHRGLRAIYDRHASFASNLIARRYNQSGSAADMGQFIYASPMRQRYGYRLMQPHPPLLQPHPPLLQRKPYHDNPDYSLPASSSSSGMMSRTSDSGSAHTPASLVDDLSASFSSAGGYAHMGIASRSVIGADPADSNPRDSEKSSIGPSSSSNGPGKGGIGLPAGHLTNPLLGAMSSISRSSTGPVLAGSAGALARKSNASVYSSSPSPLYGKPPGIAYGNIHSEGNLHRMYQRTGVGPARNTQEGSALNPEMSRPVHYLPSGLLQGQAENPAFRPSARQTLPQIPVISPAAATSPAPVAPVAPVLQQKGGSDNILPSFSRSAGRMPTTLAIRGGLGRKEGIRDISTIGAVASQAFGGTQTSAIATRSSTGLSRKALSTVNERFNETRTYHSDSPRSASFVMRRTTATSSAKALRLATTNGLVTGDSGPTGGQQNSMALTHSARIPVSAHSLSDGTPDDLVLRRVIAASRLSASAEDESGTASDSTRSHATRSDPARSDAMHTLPSHIQRHPMHNAGEHAQGEEYRAGSLSAAQRLQNRTGSFAAHRKVFVTQPSVYSPQERHIGPLSRLSGRTLQKKPVSWLSAGAGLNDCANSLIRGPRISLEFAPSRDGSPYISRRSIGTRLGGLRTGDHATIPNAPHISRHYESPLGWFISPTSTNERTNYSIPAIADHSMSAVAVDTQQDALSPAFFPAGRQTKVAGSTIARSVVADLTDMSSTYTRFTHLGPVRTVTNAQSHALPSIARSTIVRPAGQQDLRISNGHAVSVSEGYADDGRSSDWNHHISSSQSAWTAGSDSRPLAILQRSQDKLMRAPTGGGNVLATPDRPEDRYGLVSPPAGPLMAQVTRGGGELNKAPESGPEADHEETAEHVWRIMAERLVIEQERRGMSKWP